MYKGKASHWLSQKPSTFPTILIDNEIDRAAIYCTQNGNAWFGTWLMEDCPTYALACNEGIPVTTAPLPGIRCLPRHRPMKTGWT